MWPVLVVLNRQPSMVAKYITRYYGKIKSVIMFFAMNHVISWSGGKDSTATILLFRKHEKELLNPGDKVIILFIEVMFDLKNEISGHNPAIISFIKEKKKVCELWGYEVHILRSEIDYLTWFHGKLKNCPDPNRNGLTRGFPLPKGMCWVKRELKDKPRKQFLKSLDDYVEYSGFAVGEEHRLDKLQKEKPWVDSLLIKYGLTEDDARELCEKCGMLSPQYQLLEGRQKRDGCWMCPYSKIEEHEMIRNYDRVAWEKYVELENTPNLGYPKWFIHAKDTLHERDQFFKDREKESA